MSSAPLLLHYNVDCLAPVPNDGQLVAGLSNFVGPIWTGGIALLSAADEGGPVLQSFVELRTGVPEVICLSQADQFTGRRVLASGSDDGSVDLWYISKGGEAGHQLERTQSKVLHSAAVQGMAAAPGTSQLASACADGTLRLWDCGQLLACTAQLGSSGGAAWNAVAWTAEPSTIASVGQAGSLCLWDARQLGSAPAAAIGLGALALSLAATSSAGSQQLLVAGDQLGRISVFDPRNLSQPLQQRQLHQDAVHALAASNPLGPSPSGSDNASNSGSGGGKSLVASGSDDGSILLLDCARLEATRQLVPPRKEGQVPCYMRALAWQPTSCSGDGSTEQQPQLYRGGWDQLIARVPL